MLLLIQEIQKKIIYITMGQVKWTTITFLQVTIINIMTTLPKTGNTKEFLNDLE